MISNGNQSAYGDVDLDIDHDYVAPNIFGDLLGGDEVRAGSGNTSKFTFEDVMLASRRIEASGVLPLFEQWWAEDQAGKYRGGRPSILDNRAILIVSLLLASEGTALWMTEMRNIFWYRLTPEARRVIGIGHIRNTRHDATDANNWKDRTDRRLHHILDLMDAWPVPDRRKSMDRAERERVLEERDPLVSRMKRQRLNLFTNKMLQMTWDAQPPEMQKAWGGGLSVDQTALRAPSPNGRWHRDKATGKEVPRYNGKTGEEIRRPVLEIDADYYPVKLSGSPRDRDLALGGADTIPADPAKTKARAAVGRTPRQVAAAKTAATKAAKAKASTTQYEWDYMLNIVISVRDPLRPTSHPQLAMAASISTPNKEIGSVTVDAVRSILQRGHKVTRLASDLGYAGNLSVDEFQGPMRAMGVPLIRQYKSTQLGVKGGVGGALQVEGAHYCPVTPKELLNASVNLDAKEIGYTEAHKLIEERQAYRLRPKESRDKDGFMPMVCPAFGPNATLECPLREIHAKSSKKKKPFIPDKNVPAPMERGKICTQTSVSFGPDDGVEFDQLHPFGTDDWETTYKHDRNSMESFNDFIKSGPEKIRDSTVRRLRGPAAQQYIATILLVTANLRRIARAVRDSQPAALAKRKYERRRDREGMSRYVRWREKVAWVSSPELAIDYVPPVETEHMQT